jgi:hypothetical protein
MGVYAMSQILKSLRELASATHDLIQTVGCLILVGCLTIGGIVYLFRRLLG